MFRYGLLKNELFIIDMCKLEQILPMTESFHSLRVSLVYVKFKSLNVRTGFFKYYMYMYS